MNDGKCFFFFPLNIIFFVFLLEIFSRNKRKVKWKRENESNYQRRGKQLGKSLRS